MSNATKRVNNVAEADGLLKAAHLITPMPDVAPMKPQARPSLVADEKALLEELNKRGGVKLTITEGTIKLRPTNEANEAVNNGGNDIFQLDIKINEGKASPSVVRTKGA